MFVDVHHKLVHQGFWLSHVHIGGFVRMRPDSLAAARRLTGTADEAAIRATIRTTPAYFEARYLRTLEWLGDQQHSEREYTLLWLFALVDGQWGFALDVSVEFRRIFGETDAFRSLIAATQQSIAAARSRHNRRRRIAPIARPLLAVWNKFAGGV